MKKKAMIGAVLAIVALILLSLTFVTPWYGVTIDMEAEGETATIDTDFYFDESEMTTDIPGEDEETETEEYDEDDEPTSVFHNTRIFVVVAIIGTALGIIGALLVAINKLSPKIGAMLVLIGFIFAIIAPTYMMIQLPDAIGEEIEDGEDDLGGVDFLEGMADDFFGSESGTTTFGFVEVEYDASWGGTTAWFLAIVAAVLNILALGMVVTTKSGPERMTTQRYQQQEPQQQYVRQQEPQEAEQQYPQDEEWGQEQPQQQEGWEQQPQQQTQQQPQAQQQQQPSPPPQQPQQSNTCPDCGQPIRYIEEYDSWYCDNCQEYK